MSQLYCKIFLFNFYFILSALIVLPYATRTRTSPSYKLENGTGLVFIQRATYPMEHLVCESNSDYSVLVEGGFGGGELAFERVTLLINYFDYFCGFEEAITKFFPVLAINV